MQWKPFAHHFNISKLSVLSRQGCLRSCRLRVFMGDPKPLLLFQGAIWEHISQFAQPQDFVFPQLVDFGSLAGRPLHRTTPRLITSKRSFEHATQDCLSRDFPCPLQLLHNPASIFDKEFKILCSVLCIVLFVIFVDMLIFMFDTSKVAKGYIHYEHLPKGANLKPEMILCWHGKHPLSSSQHPLEEPGLCI